MRDFLSGLGAIAAALLAVVGIVMLLVDFVPQRPDNTAEFRSLCAKSGGREAFNGRHLVCVPAEQGGK